MGAGCSAPPDQLLQDNPQLAAVSSYACGCSTSAPSGLGGVSAGDASSGAPSSLGLEALPHFDDLLAVRHLSDFSDRDPVHALKFTPDGKLCTGSRDGVIKVWDPDFQNAPFCLASLTGHRSQVNALAFAPRGYLCSASNDRTVRVWCLEGKEGDCCLVVLSGHTGSVTVLEFAPGGVLCTGSSDHTIRLWHDDLLRAACIKVLEGHSGPVTSLCIADCGCLCSGARDGTVKVWSALHRGSEPPYTCVATLEGHIDGVESLVAAPSFGGEVFAGQRNGSIRMWAPSQENKRDGTTWLPKLELKGHEDVVSTLAFAPDGTLVSGSKDHSIRVWDWDEDVSTVLHTIGGCPDGVLMLVFAEDGTLCSSCGRGMVRVWECRKWRQSAKQRSALEEHWRSTTMDSDVTAPSLLQQSPGAKEVARMRADALANSTAAAVAAAAAAAAAAQAEATKAAAAPPQPAGGRPRAPSRELPRPSWEARERDEVKDLVGAPPPPASTLPIPVP
eukprot:TRINITY_DN75703_c0_g1_i1.p1 TRINITY_DN75703_c0_g1~~TRINITY_DN75703_c0_g1_i1.p1  ORF type:complete len:502 (+),score=104.74 TRINITY_DN75703_c0_g1_i1:63-1568(+)